MRAFISKLMCLIAIITLIDGHIIALQSYAWATMLQDRIPEQGVSEALSTTFDGEHPCAHCLTTLELVENKQAPDPVNTTHFQLSDLKAPECSLQKISPPVAPFAQRLLVTELAQHSSSNFKGKVPTPPPRFV